MDQLALVLARLNATAEQNGWVPGTPPHVVPSYWLKGQVRVKVLLAGQKRKQARHTSIQFYAKAKARHRKVRSCPAVVASPFRSTAAASSASLQALLWPSHSVGFRSRDRRRGTFPVVLGLLLLPSLFCFSFCLCLTPLLFCQMREQEEAEEASKQDAMVSNPRSVSPRSHSAAHTIVCASFFYLQQRALYHHLSFVLLWLRRRLRKMRW